MPLPCEPSAPLHDDCSIPGGQSRAMAIDPRSGYCSATRTFHSLRPAVPLPPPTQPLSVTSYAFSLLSPLPPHPAFIDSTTGAALTFPQLHSQVLSLSSSLLRSFPTLLSKGQLAVILSPPSLDVPVLYLSLLSLGVAISPSNPISTPDEIAHQLRLSSPSLAFATSSTAHLLPRSVPTVLLDSPVFRSFLQQPGPSTAAPLVTVNQSDPAAVLYSSGTTGRTKAVVLSHRNFIAFVASARQSTMDSQARKGPRVTPYVSLFTVPLFHVFGLSFLVRSVAVADTAVLMRRFDFVEMLKIVERHRVSFMPVSPPLVVAMAKSDLVALHDFSSLEAVGCGGAPLGKDVAGRFAARFPDVEIAQGYGLTESTAEASGTYGPEESGVYGSAGKISSNLEARIVDPTTGEALPPGERGELWLRGPTIMLGYLGDGEATAATLHPEGWLKTGDLCYIDDNGFLFIVDRLKELIKYKAYQVPPAELEHILHSHPEIADVAVVPYPDETAGEIPMAYVVRQPGSTLLEEQVKDFVAKKVASYKKIRRVAFIDAIPKNPAGKILRRELVSLAQSASKSKL